MKEIPLTRGKSTIVDDEDFRALSGYHWVAGGGSGRYAVRYENGQAILMHRVIARPDENQFVDHVNGDTLDNRRENLRPCSPTENLRNMRAIRKAGVSRFKGVYFEAKTKLWRARIVVNKRSICCGRYKDEEMAARAYDARARAFFGEFARPNFAD